MPSLEPTLDDADAFTAGKGSDEDADARLGRLLREDPHAAAPAIYERFQADVNRWVWRLMGADPDQSDIVQQVFVRIVRSAKHLRDVTRLRGWVHSITANTVFGELRKREVRRVFFRNPPPAVHADLVREVELRDLLLRAKSLIEKLPAKLRIAFVLHAVEGKSLPEIGEICGYSPATAKRRYQVANQRFQKMLMREPELLRLFSKHARNHEPIES